MTAKIMLPIWTVLITATAAMSQSQPAPEDRSATTTAPAAQPGDEIVLFRIGDKVTVTQGELRQSLQRIAEPKRRESVTKVINGLAQNHLLLLYLKDHPEIVSQKEIDADMQNALRRANVKTMEELKVSLARQQLTLEQYRQRRLLTLAHNNLARKWLVKAKDKKFLKEMFDEHPDYYNGSRVVVRHILKSIPVYLPPEQRQVRRAELAQIREDLVTGKRTWAECVTESHCTSRFTGGLIGPVSRFIGLPEELAAVAWTLKKGETSEILQSYLGYHLIQVVDRQPPYRDFDDPKTKVEMSSILQNKGIEEAMRETMKKYPIVGVHEPDLDLLFTAETRPADTMPAATPVQ